MITSDKLDPGEWLRELAQTHSRTNNDASMDAGWRRFRAQAMTRVLAEGLPGRADEHWQHLQFDLARRRFLPEWNAVSQRRRGTNQFDGHRLVFVDGVLDADQSDIANGRLSTGLHVVHADGRSGADHPALLERLRQISCEGDQRMALLSLAMARQAVWIRVEPGVAVAQPLSIYWTSNGADAAACPLVLIDLAEGATLSLVEYVHGIPTTQLQLIHATLAERAVLQHFRWIEPGADSLTMSQLQVDQGSASRYELTELATGTGTVRTTLDAHLIGHHATCRTGSAVLQTNSAQYDLCAKVRHDGAQTCSDQRARLVVHDRARAVFDSQVVVSSNARASESRQSCRGLVLSPHAEIVSRPQMELYHDEVQCKHGSSVGQLDAEALFYFAQRGIGSDEAMRALLAAFTQECLPPDMPAGLRERFDFALSTVVGRLSTEEGGA